MASREALFDRDSSLLVARGLHVLRYESGGARHDHPVAVVKPAAGFEGLIQVISPPGGVEGLLERPGSAVLVRAEDNAKIQIGSSGAARTVRSRRHFDLNRWACCRTAIVTRSARARKRIAHFQCRRLQSRRTQTVRKAHCFSPTCQCAATCRSRRTNGPGAPMRPVASKDWQSWDWAERNSRPKFKFCPDPATRHGRSGQASASLLGRGDEANLLSACG